MKRRLLVALASLALVVVALELALRLWYPIGKPGYRLAPALLHEPIPGVRRIQLMPGFADHSSVRVELGAQGYRGPALAQPKSKPRLAVVGDSLVMAENVPYEESFPARLGEHLEGRWETVSIGASGYGPDQALLRLERDWPVLLPDLVVLVLCATNDHGDLLRNKLFGLDQSGRLFRRTPRIGATLRAHFAGAAEWADDPALLRWFRSRRLRSEQEERAGSGQETDLALHLPAYEQDWAEFGRPDPVVNHVMIDPYDIDVAVAPDSASAAGKRKVMAAMLAEWARSMESRRTALVVVVVPSPVDLDPTFRIRVDRERFPGYDPRALTGSCVEAALKAKLPVRDLYELFEAADPAGLFVGVNDIHWNARGIDLAATDVAAWLGGLGYE